MTDAKEVRAILRVRALLRRAEILENELVDEAEASVYAVLDVADEEIVRLTRERDEARDELWRLETDVGAALTPFGCWFMDPPDGGDVSLGEQVKRMSEELVKTRQQRDDAIQSAKHSADWAAQAESDMKKAEKQRDEARRDAAILDRVQDNLDIMNRSGEMSDAMYEKFYEVIPHERYLMWLAPLLDAARTADAGTQP